MNYPKLETLQICLSKSVHPPTSVVNGKLPTKEFSMKDLILLKQVIKVLLDFEQVMYKP